MTLFASRENSLTEQQAILDLIVDTFDARLVEPTAVFDHEWYWKQKLPERKGQRCRVISRGAMNSILVEFEDGKRVLTSRHAARLVEGGKKTEGGRHHLRASVDKTPVSTPPSTSPAHEQPTLWGEAA